MRQRSESVKSAATFIRQTVFRFSLQKFKIEITKKSRKIMNLHHEHSHLKIFFSQNSTASKPQNSQPYIHFEAFLITNQHRDP